jgi:transcriptional regulator with XRE-family HTH domain
MSVFAIKIGQVIKKKRTSLGLSQEALAAIAGINRSYLGEIERGEVELSAINLQRIADGLGIKLSELILLYENEND